MVQCCTDAAAIQTISFCIASRTAWALLAGAQKELEDIAAKGGEAAVDANAALTGIYQSGSEMDKAAKTWAKVCQTLKDPTSGNDDNDASLPGCKYMEKGWLMHTRRWPIVAIDLLGKFIDLQE